MLSDLNLIRVFLAIWDLRSLTDAADRLHLTQPAVSHALKRLRTQFDDPLFTRSTRSMAPTEVASRLHEPFRRALELVDRAVQDIGSFDPSLATRTFRIAMSDIATHSFLPSLLTHLCTAAPSVRIEVVHLDADSVGAALRTGEVDVALGYLPQLVQCISSQVLVDTFVGLIRADHPFRSEYLDETNFGELEFIYVGSGAPGHQMAERYLDEIGVVRRIGLKLAHFTVTPEVIRQTDFAVIYPRSMSERINANGAFRTLPLYLDMPQIEIKVHTHPRSQTDPGVQWLSQTLTAVCQGGVDRR